MLLCFGVVLSALLDASRCAEDLTFPPGFKFGVASAAYQVEGAWNISGKTESIWDRFTHVHPEIIADRSNADVACDSYHKWKRDIEMVGELGVHFYRFSISWSRLLPTGFPNNISEDGKNYYGNLIDGLLEKGIEPVVTIYHFDLPQRIQDLGGWTNPLISDWFAEYARVVYSLYADRVRTWLTINEILMVCDATYNLGAPPGVLDPEIAPYLCNKHALIAHAKAWRLYDEEFKPKYHGRVSLANQLIWFEPLTKDDEEIAELARQNMGGRSSHAIYSKKGGWPPSIEKLFAEKSKKQGYPSSKLPPFTKDEIELVKGTYDFYAMNYYTSRLIGKAKAGEKLGVWPTADAPDLNGKYHPNPNWKEGATAWFKINPKGIRRQLVWLKKQYGDLSILITENGYAGDSGMNDPVRVKYYRDHLIQVLLAIKKDGVNVTGYTAWTLMDNFEWIDGYRTKFGLYEVDFASSMRTRRPRASAHYYKHIIQNHSMNVPFNFTKHEPLSTTAGFKQRLSEYFYAGYFLGKVYDNLYHTGGGHSTRRGWGSGNVRKVLSAKQKRRGTVSS